jgi:subtilisin family serine protease
MADDKLSADYLEAVKGVRSDKAITALVRTKAPEPDRTVMEQVESMVQAERLATRRADLLRQVTDRYEEGPAFRANLEDAMTEAQAKVVRAAPQATSLWLADAVAVSGTRKEIEDLSKHEDVVSIEPNPDFEVPTPLRTPLEDIPDTVDGSAWGVAKIAAPEVWGGLGRGDGVLIGHLDTGVDDTHPALAGKVAFFQEFDAIGSPVASATHDSDVHGTHTAGTMVGRTFRGVNIGVAPEARLASALVLSGGTGTFAQIIAGMQWAIGQGVHVVNMSLGGLGYSTIWNLPVLNATLAGVLVVASIGNSGQGTSGGPGNDPLSVGVGATNHLEQVAGFSSGQTLVSVPWFFLTLRPYIKPDISAPGVQVESSIPGPDVAAFNGTSMAAPHVAGATALLLSTETALQGDPFATRAILLGTVEDFGEAGRDQRFGFGRVDAQSAAEQAVAFQ